MILAEKAQPCELRDRQIFRVVLPDIFKDQFKLGCMFIFKLRTCVFCLSVGQQERCGIEKQRFEHHFVTGAHFTVCLLHLLKDLQKLRISRVVFFYDIGKHQRVPADRMQIFYSAYIG